MLKIQKITVTKKKIQNPPKMLIPKKRVTAKKAEEQNAKHIPQGEEDGVNTGEH